MVSPVSHALEQYKFRSHFAAHVTNVGPSKRQRGLFTVVFVQGEEGIPLVGVKFVTLQEADSPTVDECVQEFFRSQPQLRTWVQTYDPRNEFIIASALTMAGSDQSQNVSQSALLTFAQLAELDAASFQEQQPTRDNSPRDKSSPRGKSSPRIMEELD